MAKDANKKRASYLHHTATTQYLCCIPALEDSRGAGCVGLARAKIQSISNFTKNFEIILIPKNALLLFLN